VAKLQLGVATVGEEYRVCDKVFLSPKRLHQNQFFLKNVV